MKIQKKWLVVFVIIGLAGLFLNLGFNQVSMSVDKSSDIAMEIIEKRPFKTVNTNKPKQIKPVLDDSHIKYAEVSLEIDDDMEYFDDTNEGMHLKEHFDWLENTEPGSQERMDGSIEEMRQEPEMYTEKLLEVYDEVDRDDYLSKYKIVYMMENIQSPSAIPFFSELAVSDLPEDIKPYKGDGYIDERREESLLRLRAVGGLYALASKGDTKARKALMDTILKSKIKTVKNDAIWAYLSTSENIDAEKEYLKTVLPEKDHPFFTAELTDIEDVQKMLERSSEYDQ